MYCCLHTELQRKLSKTLKVTYIIMIMYNATPSCMIPLYNGFYLFPLPRAVNSNRLIFYPSKVEIHHYYLYHKSQQCSSVNQIHVQALSLSVTQICAAIIFIDDTN